VGVPDDTEEVVVFVTSVAAESAVYLRGNAINAGLENAYLHICLKLKSFEN